MDIDALFASVMWGLSWVAAGVVYSTATRRSPAPVPLGAVSAGSSVAVPTEPHRMEAAWYRPTWLGVRS